MVFLPFRKHRKKFKKTQIFYLFLMGKKILTIKFLSSYLFFVSAFSYQLFSLPTIMHESSYSNIDEQFSDSQKVEVKSVNFDSINLSFQNILKIDEGSEEEKQMYKPSVFAFKAKLFKQNKISLYILKKICEVASFMVEFQGCFEIQERKQYLQVQGIYSIQSQNLLQNQQIENLRARFEKEFTCIKNQFLCCENSQTGEVELNEEVLKHKLRNYLESD